MNFSEKKTFLLAKPDNRNYKAPKIGNRTISKSDFAQEHKNHIDNVIITRIALGQTKKSAAIWDHCDGLTTTTSFEGFEPYEVSLQPATLLKIHTTGGSGQNQQIWFQRVFLESQ